MVEYENLKSNLGETVQEFSTTFNRVYNLIPTDIKPPGFSLLQYPEGFDVEIDYQLREMNPATLEVMQNNDIGVEENFLAKKEKMKTKRSSI